jgi:hypothetical protein
MENNAIASEKEREERENILEKGHKSKSKQVEDSSFESPKKDDERSKNKSKLEIINVIQQNPVQT